MEYLEDQFTKMFKCLVNVSRPDKKGVVKLVKAELLWDKKTDTTDNPNSVLDNTLLDDFLNMMKETIIPQETVEDTVAEAMEQVTETSMSFDNEEEEEEIWVPDSIGDAWLGECPF